MKKKISNALLVFPALLGLVACGTNKLDLEKNAPDFSSRKREFMTFGYSSTNDGTYTENGVKMHTGTDYRTVENFSIYKAAGLNVMMIQQNYSYGGENWEASQTKWMMDLCIGAEIDKCIIVDYHLYNLSQQEHPIVGEGREFETQEDLNAYVADCMKDYSKHPCFYGLLIRDEPLWQMLPAYGAIYRAIKAVNKDYYLEANLLPLDTAEQARYRYCEDYKSCTALEAYDKYIESFLKETQAEKILMDSYPFLVSGSSTYLKADHLTGVSYLAKKCKDKGVRFEVIAQTFAGKISGNDKWAEQTVATMNWQMNTYMGFGAKTFAYFTYWRKADNNSGANGEWFTDGTSFVTLHGERTPLYYTMQTLHKEMQAFAPCMYDFAYQGCKAISIEPTPYDTTFMNGVNNDEFALLKDESINADDGSLMLMTELKDPTTGQYMYMVMNAVNPLLKKSEYEDVSMHYTLNFGSEFNAVEVYYRGQKKLIALNNGVYSGYLDAGYADYVMPYKA